MNGFHGLPGKSAATYIRLVCRYYQEKTQLFESVARLWYTWQYFEFVQPARRIGLTFTNQGAIDDTVTVQEDSALRRIGVLAYWRVGVHGQKFGVQSSIGFQPVLTAATTRLQAGSLCYTPTASHLVCWTFSFGCETNRCQITA